MASYLEFLLENQATFLENLDEDLLASLIEYTDEAYENINAGLRGSTRLSETSKNHIKNIDKIFEMVPVTTEPLTLYRGVEKSSDTTYTGGYVSASSEKEVARRFMENARGKKVNCCLIELNVLPGSKIINVQSVSVSNESEFILDRQGSFNLTHWELGYQDEELGQVDKYFITYMPSTVGLVTSQPPSSTLTPFQFVPATSSSRSSLDLSSYSDESSSEQERFLNEMSDSSSRHSAPTPPPAPASFSLPALSLRQLAPAPASPLRWYIPAPDSPFQLASAPSSPPALPLPQLAPASDSPLFVPSPTSPPASPRVLRHLAPAPTSPPASPLFDPSPTSPPASPLFDPSPTSPPASPRPTSPRAAVPFFPQFTTSSIHRIYHNVPVLGRFGTMIHYNRPPSDSEENNRKSKKPRY